MTQLRMKERPQSGPVSLTVSQADLARMVGVSRQTLNVLLGKLAQAGLIEAGFRHIRVLDAARLAEANGAHEAVAPLTGKRRARVSRDAARASGGRAD
jgi:DNA-binding GntR family transcriptional regulator